jgi:hypothetical protein
VGKIRLGEGISPRAEAHFQEIRGRTGQSLHNLRLIFRETGFSVKKANHYD